ncbi:hypothetical protein [Luteolibacter sp. LG18]|uniref:hypothetical protein n=1 Tax=Luteolibacter sp. LG18 TaxID=2819286 RepID=UPI002B322684|nr:hypothetical protein llg_38710 [Luteolibacter sp. LG18]
MKPASIAPFLSTAPAWSAQLLTNTGFETTPFPSGWTATGVTSTTGLGSSLGAKLPYNTSAVLSQNASASAANFTADVSFQIAGTNEAQSFRLTLPGGIYDAVEVRTATGGILQVKYGTDFYPLTKISGGTTFAVPVNSTVKLRIIGRNFGTANAEYDLVWSDAGSSTLSHAATGLKTLTPLMSTRSPVTGVRFARNVAAANSFTVDDVSLQDSAATPPAADYKISTPEPDKLVNISGIYPHLAMSNTSGECGTGAVVPWAGKLWTMTYGPHLPNGSDDGLYEIALDLTRIIRPEGIGGTPANRFIHTASNQLIMGPYFIDANRNVRSLSYSTAPGRYTATAAHLSDPNRVYMFTMEDGLYDINVNDLSFITRYPDVQGTSDRFLFGYHGKGAYTGQGRLVVTNNGEPDQKSPSGVLAIWDGTTVQQNGGSYLATNDPNTAESRPSPVAAQTNYMAGWNQVVKMQHCEATGPGDIRGNQNPSDPVWVNGFDAKSVVLRTYENGQWNLWRLPKGSYTHDGTHGWHTEWPRIREISPGKRLMHMHGIFYDFPATFSAADFSGLTPICDYEKMPVDYCSFNGQLVIGKNDTSKFDNALVPRAQSNLWFGQPDDLKKWGAPHGHGGVWLNESVAANTTSEPFLVKGFSRATLHLRKTTGSAASIEIQTSSGTGAWTTLRTVQVPSSGSSYELLNDLNTGWVRLRALDAATNLTAYFILGNPYPHVTPASTASDEFAALADIRDTAGTTEGVIRTMNSGSLPLEFAATHTNGTGSSTASGYFRIGGAMKLDAVTDSTAESTLRTAAAATKDFGSDAASAWVMQGTAKLRLPMLDAAYDNAFASGWARGFREVVTERQMLNCHGSLYEVPRDISGDKRRMKPIATHGKRLADFASWRGLFVATGVLDSAPASDKVVRSTNGEGALWLGEVDDLWRMGEPRGFGGPWKNTAVTANTASDPYLMYGYDRKELRLSHTSGGSVAFTVEVDFLGDNTWVPYSTFNVAAGETFTHVFPEGYSAHWVRVTSNTATTATATFFYGPVDKRDALLDWARDHGLATGGGRGALQTTDTDHDGIADLFEYFFALDPQVTSPDIGVKLKKDAGVHTASIDLRTDIQNVALVWEISDDLEHWSPAPSEEVKPADQTGIPSGMVRRTFKIPAGETHKFGRLKYGVTP